MVKKCLNCGEVKTQSILNFGSIPITSLLSNEESFTLNYEKCEKCGGEWIQVDYKGLVICDKCSRQKQFLVEHEKPSYKEPPKEVCFYAYKRINHFREILAQFQAKETTLIPNEVIENIKNQLIKNLSLLDGLDLHIQLNIYQ